MKPFTLRKRRKKENGPVPQIAINQTTPMSILQFFQMTMHGNLSSKFLYFNASNINESRFEYRKKTYLVIKIDQ